MALAGAELPQPEVFSVSVARLALADGAVGWHLLLAREASSPGREQPLPPPPCRPLATGLCPGPGPAPPSCCLQGQPAWDCCLCQGASCQLGKRYCVPQGRAGGADSRLQPLLPGAKESPCWPRQTSKSSRGLWPVSLVWGFPVLSLLPGRDQPLV